jgi:hypothetical protein
MNKIVYKQDMNDLKLDIHVLRQEIFRIGGFRSLPLWFSIEANVGTMWPESKKGFQLKS